MDDPARQAIVEALRRMGLAAPGETVALTPLAGGVSSDIYRADLARGPVCVKRALPKLKVAADWRAPTERNRYEVGWLRFAATVVPDAVPQVLGADEVALAFAMPWLPPERYPVWKSLLRDGLVEPAFAGQVGRALAAIHAESAGRADLARDFATDANFHAIRLEPYLEATGRAHPDLAAALAALLARTASTRLALVHGDVSPKNVLAGPRGPVFLDAECAWYGDPAFDLAFVLNHLLLKGVWQPHWRGGYLHLYERLVDAYRAHVAWEPWPALDARTAGLLPGLLLGRVDGKSPAEYVTADQDKDAIRAFARAHLSHPVAGVLDLARRWRHPG